MILKQTCHRGTSLSLCAALLLGLCLSGGAQAEPYAAAMPTAGEPVEVSIHTEGQAQYLQDSYDSIEQYAGVTEDRSAPQPVRLTWEEKSGAVGYRVKVSESDLFEDAWEYDTEAPEVAVYNSKVAMTYYWMVTARYPDGTSEDSEIYSYRVAAEAPRNVYIPGVTNVRDIGGWRIGEDGFVRQGLLYRGGRFDAAGRLLIGSDGIQVLKEQLGIQTEIDLRLTTDSQITESLIGVRYVAAPMDFNKWITDENNREVRKVFQVLADESNYPVYMHCSIGTDRTGYISYLVNGLLGVSEEDLFRDYLFSNFGKINTPRTLKPLEDTYHRTINRDFAGDTLSERIEAFLLSVGVTQEEIDAVRRILSASNHMPGDVNGDGNINVADYGLTLAHVREIRLLDRWAFQRADVNGDGNVNVADYGRILAHVREIQPLF